MSDTDFDELERAYNHALDLEKAGRLDEAARAWRRVLEIDPEDCGGAAVRLAAMQRGKTPERASPAYVMTLFDQHAEAFDDILVRQLGYDVPNMIARALATHAPGPYPRLLDLGCGTGLCAVALEAITRERVGVDLSEAMIELAAERDLYDDLYIGDITGFLEDDNGEPDWDLVVAADVLPYLGDVGDLFGALSAVSTPAASSRSQPKRWIRTPSPKPATSSARTTASRMIPSTSKRNCGVPACTRSPSPTSSCGTRKTSPSPVTCSWRARTSGAGIYEPEDNAHTRGATARRSPHCTFR